MVDFEPVDGCEECELLTLTFDAPTTCRECQEDQLELNITCPHCSSIFKVLDNGWSALVCLFCKKDVERPDWLVPLGSLDLKPK